MAIGLGDVLEIRMTSSCLGQGVLNVWHYFVQSLVGDPPIYADFIQEFVENVILPLAEIQNEGYRWLGSTTLNLNGDPDIWQETYSIAGQGTSQALPPFFAASFRYNRETTITRNGYKRISGMGEGSITDGSWTFDPTALALVIQGMEEVITITSGGASCSFQPCILGRNPDGSYDFTRIGTAQNVVLQPNPTTQNTRKIGVGM